MNYLKQSTAATVKMGPFKDATDAVTNETGLTIQKADVRLSKNGGDYAAAHSDQGEADAGAAHDELGEYNISLDATDTNTLGNLRIAIEKTGALRVTREFTILAANVYDSLIAASASLKTDLETIKTQTVTCGAGVTVLASVGTAATSTAQTGDAYAIVAHADYGNAKLVRSTTPANTLTVDAAHKVAVPDTQKVDVNTWLTATPAALTDTDKLQCSVQHQSTAIFQQYAKALHRVSGTVYFVSTTGNDSNDGLTPVTAKLSPKTTIEAASAGDFIQIGPGTFALGNNVINTPDGVAVMGSGIGITIISSTAEYTSGAIIRPPSDAKISDFTIRGLSELLFQFPLGASDDAGQSAYTNSVGERLGIEAASDGYYANHATPCSMVLRDCVIKSQYDCLNIRKAAHVLEVHRSVMKAVGPCVLGGNQDIRCVNNEGGTVDIYNSVMLAKNAEGTTYGLRAYDYGIIRCHDSVLSVQSTSTKYSIYTEAGSTVLMNKSSYDSSIVGGSGSIEKIGEFVPWDTTWDAQAESEAYDALVSLNLDHLCKIPTFSADMTSEVADNTVFSRMLANGDTSAFVPSSHGLVALQTHGDSNWATADVSGCATSEELAALETHGDSTWATATGFSTHNAADVVTALGTGSTLTACLTATGFATSSALSAAVTKIDTIDGIVDAILEDTGTSIPASINAIEGGGATAEEIWALAGAIDGKTPAEAMQIIASAAAGVVSGAGTGTEVFKGLDGDTTRITVTVDDDGNRSEVTYG